MATTKVIIAGVSALALAAIPAALAIGASGWLGFTITAHGFQRTLAQEQRRAVYVAAPTPPKAKMAFDISSRGAVVIERADLDGRDLTVYLRNRSHVHQCFQQVHWALRAPDGTMIGGESKYIGDGEGGMEPGEKAEGQLHITEDPRAVAIRLSVSSQESC